MAALSPAHFLLWARLTTASPAPSVTPSEGTNRRTSVGVSSSTCPRHKSYLSFPLLLDHKRAYFTVCVCVCEHACVCACHPSPLCLGSSSAGWLSVSITSSVFATLNHTAALSVCLPHVSPPYNSFPPSSSSSSSQVSGWGA